MNNHEDKADGHRPDEHVSTDILRKLFEAIPRGVAILETKDGGLNFLIKDINATAEALEGMPRHRIIGRSIGDAFPEVLKSGLFRVLQEVHRTGQTTTHSVPIYHRGRWSRWRENIIFPLSATEIATVYRDTTAERTAAEELRLSEEKYRAIFSCSSDAIFIHDAASGRVIEVNDAMLKIFGCTREQALSAGPDTFSSGEPPYSNIEAAAHIEQARTAGQTTFQWYSSRYDGSLFWTEVKLSFTEIAGKGRVIAVVRDLTEEKRQQELSEQIRQVQKLESLGVLAGGIAHDFNNILMAIIGNTELALHDLSPLSPVRDNLHDIESSGRRAADLCRQLLAYSGKGHFVIETINLSELISEMANMLQVSLAKTTVLKLELAGDLPTVSGDPTQIRQILMNLVINASEALDNDDGRVTITTGEILCDDDCPQAGDFPDDLAPGRYCYAEITDTGHGMDQATIKRIFEPFFTTKFTGRGLGLAAALGIVRGHKGALSIQSEPGRGSTFRVLFPTCGSPAAALGKTGNPPSDAWQGQGLVLLVDDESHVLATSAAMLGKLGFDTITAMDGEQALEIYRRRQNDIVCVLMDLTMPRMNGEAAFSELHKLNPGVKVILSSGYNEQELNQTITGEGANGFLQKPYKLADLRRVMKAALTTAP